MSLFVDNSPNKIGPFVVYASIVIYGSIEDSNNIIFINKPDLYINNNESKGGVNTTEDIVYRTGTQVFYLNNIPFISYKEFYIGGEPGRLEYIQTTLGPKSGTKFLLIVYINSDNKISRVLLSEKNSDEIQSEIRYFLAFGSFSGFYG